SNGHDNAAQSRWADRIGPPVGPWLHRWRPSGGCAVVARRESRTTPGAAEGVGWGIMDADGRREGGNSAPTRGCRTIANNRLSISHVRRKSAITVVGHRSTGPGLQPAHGRATRPGGGDRCRLHRVIRGAASRGSGAGGGGAGSG